MSTQRDLSGTPFTGPGGNGSTATSGGVSGHIYSGYFTPDKKS